MLKCEIGSACMGKYIHLYKESAGIPTKKPIASFNKLGLFKVLADSSSPDIEAYMGRSKENLVNELIKAKANELRAKKDTR